MRSEGDRWDPATVVGLKSTDSVLVIGNAAFMPWLTEVARDIMSVRKPSELVQLIKEGDKFDKIILPKEAAFSNDLIPLISSLLDNEEGYQGLFVAFPPNDGWNIGQAMDFYFPNARQWWLSTTFGDVFISDPHGYSWRFTHG